MRPSDHVVASTVVSALFGMGTQSLSGAMVCWLSGIFIDSDHVLDFVLAKGRFPWKYNELLSFCAEERKGRLYLVLHSYELWALYWLVLFLFGGPPAAWGLAVGVSAHMLLDQWANPLKPYVYFLTYRIRTGFEKEAIFPAEYYRQMRDE